ncbi:peptidyl-prolyl isomerase, gliding motility-associated [Robiginitalea myxolifaciens]|uniref:Peptidyl-prolyl cis-trans isomerase n=1 Tax=Robiginitalea myxolifaciens TaxID=400055 RepID=A0A1I6FNS5_9FLAO|nr:gliding motility-associated peptidyl-prolyl isomerase GldI [Robiginitalea myxolifaciens]SFR31447.1 peptidyl-prolyl isomerase, gliding motility-associated [Robiginitalea myxolifaciens]
MNVKPLAFILLLLLLAGCQDAVPRWPVEEKGGSFLKVSAERNRKLLEEEMLFLEELLAKDSLRTYTTSASGTKYYFETKAPETEPIAAPDDLVTLQYNLMTWGGDTIYSREEIGLLKYKVDKQELFPGMRSSVKLLRQGESAVFWFPSSLGYGYHGDQDRIGPNLPLKSQVWILDIEKSKDSLPLKP